MSIKGKSFTNSPSLTKQSFAHQTDIKTIMSKVRKTGRMPPPQQLVYGDFSEVPDLHTILDKTNRVKDSFMRLPPEIRANFKNDPQRWLSYMEDPKKTEEHYELGLKIRPEEVKDEPQRVVVVESNVEPKGEPAQ